MRFTPALLLAAGFVLAALAPTARAAGPKANAEKASNDKVLGVLNDESAGRLKSRADALKDLLKTSPECEAARWQAGQVKRGDAWLPFEAVPADVAKNEAVLAYRKRRPAYRMLRGDQIRLADWCRDHNLPVRERAHLTAALQLSRNVNDPVLRKRLGWRLVNGAWVQPEMLAKQRQAIAKLRSDRRAWAARIGRVVRRLSSRRLTTRRQAVKELKKIDDPAALPALEAALSRGSLEQGRLLVDVLAGMKTHHAADALARLAVFSRWDVVRKDASRKLRSRAIEAFAPELLAALRTTVDSRVGLYVNRQGVHLIHVAASETQNKRQVAAGRSSTIINPVGVGQTEFAGGRGRQRRRIDRARNNAAIGAGLRARATKKVMDRQNEQIKIWNDRICAVLTDGTGVSLSPNPQKWWEWWQDYNQIPKFGEDSTSSGKTYECRYYYETRVETVDVSEPTVRPSVELTPVRPPGECLVAGTPIFTDRGFVNVEDVKVGDLVLAKDAATGELSFQPVLQTTIRESEPVMKVTTNQGSLRSTGGHTFWVSGQGWTKLKRTKPGQRFHTATGTALVEKIEQDGREKMYNLVVADVHTYFVGRSLVLSHDVTFAEPTDTVVPGLNFRDANPRSSR